MQFCVILDAVIVVLLLRFIEPFILTYMAVNYGACVVNIPTNCIYLEINPRTDNNKIWNIITYLHIS